MLKKILGIFGALAVVVMLAALCSTPGEPVMDTPRSLDTPAAQTTNSAPSGKPAPKTEALEVLDHTVRYDEFGIRYVVGSVRNNTNHTYAYVQIGINLYDDSGAQVGSTMDNTNNLEPGGIWKFEAMIWDDEATHYKIIDVSGF